MEFSRQEYWSGWPFPSPEDLPDPGIEPEFHALQADSLPFELQGSSLDDWSLDLFYLAWGQDCRVTRRGAALCEEIPEASQPHSQKLLSSGEFHHHLWEIFNSSHLSQYPVQGSPRGHIWQNLETLLIVKTWEMLLTYSEQKPGCCKIFYKTAPHIQELSSPKCQCWRGWEIIICMIQSTVKKNGQKIWLQILKNWFYVL